MSHVHSFAPVAREGARVLVLGSMPGKVSIAAQQYYAHPRNALWPILMRLVGEERELDYTQRLEVLMQNGVALWDVLQTCTRSSSLDSDIVESSIVPNDFPAFLQEFPTIERVLFNGAKAAQCFERHVKGKLENAGEGLQLLRLPSTSPAHASLNFEQKFAAWQEAFGTSWPG